MASIFIKVTTDDFLQDQVLNERRIKAYKEIAKDYNVSESTIRDVFHLGINFAIANMKEIELPTEEELNEGNPYPDEDDCATIWAFADGFREGANFILDKLKGGTN